MENYLSSKEIDVLIEALDAWEDAVGEEPSYLGKMMEALDKSDVPDEIKGEVHLEVDRKRRQVKEEKASRREIAILLKAKLITVKHEESIRAAMTVQKAQVEPPAPPPEPPAVKPKERKR